MSFSSLWLEYHLPTHQLHGLSIWMGRYAIEIVCRAPQIRKSSLQTIPQTFFRLLQLLGFKGLASDSFGAEFSFVHKYSHKFIWWKIERRGSYDLLSSKMVLFVAAIEPSTMTNGPLCRSTKMVLCAVDNNAVEPSIVASSSTVATTITYNN
jgi:hypothetical protein